MAGSLILSGNQFHITGPATEKAHSQRRYGGADASPENTKQICSVAGFRSYSQAYTHLHQNKSFSEGKNSENFLERVIVLFAENVLVSPRPLQHSKLENKSTPTSAPLPTVKILTSSMVYLVRVGLLYLLRTLPQLQEILHCVPKNVHLFIFQITLSKINRF